MRSLRLAVVVGVLVLACGVAAPSASGFGVFGIKQNEAASFQSISADGRYVAWETVSTNLGPGDADALYDVYVRDTETGVTVLASRATGSSGAKVNADARYPSISANGRFVTFHTRATNLDPVDTDTRPDVYVRDLVADTTTLVSRATGAAGVKGNGDSVDHELSADGRYVVFASTSNNLHPDDPEGSFLDVYVRDLQTDTTTLASRATGTPGAKADRGGREPSISDDGRYVAFQSGATNLDPGDTDFAVPDIYVRDLQANTTTLVSRATGAAGAKGTAYSGTPSISGDGTAVAFATESRLDPVDTDTLFDVYVRDLLNATTTLASRASGASGAKGNGAAFLNIDHAISADGTRVAFESRASNTAPDDTETSPDIHVRDLATDTTLLASRTSAGTNSSSTATVPSMSASGRYVSFVSSNMTPDDTDIKGDVFVRDLDGGATYLESRCCPGYARPRGATPLRVPLVPAFEACVSPNRVHGPALDSPSCWPPAPASDHLTIGTPDLNGKPLKAVGSARYVTIVGDTSTVADEADVGIEVRMQDVRDGGKLADYAGELEARVGLRLTDRSNGAAATETGTVQDHDLSVVVPCDTTADTTIGSSCAVTTTADALVPGLVKEGARAIWGLDRIRLFDGGADADGETRADNTLFATQGVYVP